VPWRTPAFVQDQPPPILRGRLRAAWGRNSPDGNPNGAARFPALSCGRRHALGDPVSNYDFEPLLAESVPSGVPAGSRRPLRPPCLQGRSAAPVEADRGRRRQAAAAPRSGLLTSLPAARSSFHSPLARAFRFPLRQSCRAWRQPEPQSGSTDRTGRPCSLSKAALWTVPLGPLASAVALASCSLTFAPAAQLTTPWRHGQEGALPTRIRDP
jgi:hypothetical protein